jgi:hypothetical protein
MWKRFVNELWSYFGTLVIYPHSGIYPLGSFFNHSCDFNSEAIREGRVLVFRAVKDIAEGEEISISYIDATLPFQKRYSQLQQEYYFECGCPRCITEKRGNVKFSKLHKRK